MRTPEDRIKQAILHPENEVRAIAIRHFADAYSSDPTLMPLVIGAVEKYGRANSLALFSTARGLVQTPATTEWLINEFRRNDDPTYRGIVAGFLADADPALLVSRQSEILALPGFPEDDKEQMNDRIALHSADWPSLWTRFESEARRIMQARTPVLADNIKLDRIVEALGRHPKEGRNTVISLLQRSYKGRDRALMEWLEPQIVTLAGRMRLEDSIPRILDRLGADDTDMDTEDRIPEALIRIGTDAVVDGAIRKWFSADIASHFTLAEVLSKIYTGKAFAHLLQSLSEFEDDSRYEADFDAEDGDDLRICIALGILSHLDTDAIEPVRSVLLDYSLDDYDEMLWDLQFGLVAAATLMGKTFPEYEAWREDALARHYSAEPLPPVETAAPPAGRKPPAAPATRSEKSAKGSGNAAKASNKPDPDAPTIYRLKLTLKDIDPPIWRRLLVPDCSLHELHIMIQIAMGWEDAHLYAFRIRDREYSNPDMTEGQMNADDSTSTRLSEVISRKGQKFNYEYDFGDSWLHEIVVEALEKARTGEHYPVCVDGQRACPPEDIGGAWGYQEFVESLRDREEEQEEEEAEEEDEGYEEYDEWDSDFDPEKFEIGEVNQSLRKAFKRKNKA